ncbi:PREDICTED: CUGBP Elav-like family member 6 isoform X2 [Amphimedon queenslandica]|uniref:RRM domain-containing protein n=2 Tax=Amphimedon queenslandica TaxID=400682 RepID=A0AAN0I9T9_AMPQE|nr:PREDICTED: CUGBP Elav-like family member 6 isoform X2 [Amphimedon queenslandica]|eukprot:XP_003383400.1 PREDICTED: CUGBP Elav-like family member 6 isoform X2 [Amphimedon queenslandica]
MEIENPQSAYDTDPDKIKLFVGQIPKEYDEEQIKALLEEFGPIHEINIIKDKEKRSKGCAFVTYCLKESAVNAQQNLHEKRTLPAMNHPMQVKPATQSNRDKGEDRRLFVGQLSPEMSDEQVANLFSPFGLVEDVSILRDKDGVSKKAAFVRMGSRNEAMTAIQGLHQSCTLPGVSHPVNVKIADTEREKEMKRFHHQVQVNQPPSAMAPNVRFSGLAPNIGIDTYSYMRQSMMPSALTLPSYQLAQLQQAAAAAATSVGNSFGLGTGAMPANMPLGSHLMANQPGPSPITYNSSPQGLGNLGSAVLSASANNPSNKIASEQQLMHSYQLPGMQQYQAAMSQGPHYGRYIHQKQREGPEGGNLFIYHLPNDIKDSDLANMFSQFGKVISAKVFLDKHTNLSKCFGFVSFETSQAGQAAIQAMNGFQIGTKRLKVQLKRPKEANKPYW